MTFWVGHAVYCVQPETACFKLECGSGAAGPTQVSTNFIVGIPIGVKNPINSVDSQEKIFKVALPVSLEAVSNLAWFH